MLGTTNEKHQAELGAERTAARAAEQTAAQIAARAAEQTAAQDAEHSAERTAERSVERTAKRGADAGRMRRGGMFRISLAALLVLLLLSVVAAAAVGPISIPFGQTARILALKLIGWEIGDAQMLAGGMEGNIIWEIRMPRVLMAMLVGAGLAMCGTAMQAAVQNPLADPYLMGISAGAVLGATFAILIGFGRPDWIGEAGVAFWAFAGALGSSALVLALASVGGRTSATKLVLAGLVMNALCGAFSNFIIAVANQVEGIRSLTFWTMGSLAATKWDTLPIMAVFVIGSMLFLFAQIRVLNTMLVGDEAAMTLGMNLTSLRRLHMVVTSIVTGVIVANCGLIGFVGLIVPHVARAFAGSDHRRLLPAAIVAGALFLVWTDIGARTILPKTELPIGVITAFIGAPMFMWILIRKNYGFGGK